MNNSMQKRLEALQKKIGGTPIILVMADGTERIIDGRRPHYWQFWSHAVARFQAEDAGKVPPASPRLDAELAWLKSCTKIVEVAGEWNLIKILLEGPVECEDEDEESENKTANEGRERGIHLRFQGEISSP